MENVGNDFRLECSQIDTKFFTKFGEKNKLLFFNANKEHSRQDTTTLLFPVHSQSYDSVLRQKFVKTSSTTNTLRPK
jgi:hypothetical protein